MTSCFMSEENSKNWAEFSFFIEPFNCWVFKLKKVFIWAEVNSIFKILAISEIDNPL